MNHPMQSALVLSTILAGWPAPGADLARGKPDVKTARAVAFGPGGVLFVGDNDGAAVFAIDTGDREPDPIDQRFEVLDVRAKIAELLGAGLSELSVRDLAINPASGKAYLSYDRGRVREWVPVIARVGRSGKVEVVSLDDVPFARVALPNPPAPGARPPGGFEFRDRTITDLAYFEGRVYASGLSSAEKYSSRIVSIAYPFADPGAETSVEIYHGARGEIQTKPPILAFAFCRIGGESHLLTAHGSLPLVKFPLSALKPGEHVRGTTVAELGPRNNPLSMIVYKDGGRDFILMATSKGLFKISTEGIADASITEQVFGTAGLAQEKIGLLGGVMKIAPTGHGNALMLRSRPFGGEDLVEVPLP